MPQTEKYEIIRIMNPENLTQNDALEELLNADSDSSLEFEQGRAIPTDQGEASVTNNPIEVEEEEDVKGNDVDYSDNVLYSFLQSRGVEDPSKIQMEDENGNINEYDFNSLSFDEQKTILEELTNPGISEYEASVINFMRQNNASLEQIVDYYSEQKLKAYLEQNPDAVRQQTYSIDDYTDDQLYVMDLKVKFPDFTDEELLSKLDSAKENEALFTKEINALRTTYKAQEDRERQNAEEQQKQAQIDLRNDLTNVVSAFNEIALDYQDPESDSLVVEDADKADIISYLLDQGPDGKSQFVKDVEDPKALIEMAWFRTKGAEVLSELNRYWKDELKKERKEIARLKSQLEKQTRKNDSVVVQPTLPTEPKRRTIGSAWDNSDLLG